MKIHTLQPRPGSKRNRKRIGRGNASGRGTYSGRGLKGQRARSGGKKGLKIKGLRKTLKRIPKLRGFKSLNPKLTAVTLKTLDRYFESGELVNALSLSQRRIIATMKERVKVISGGTLRKKLHLEVEAISTGARQHIEEVGGTVRIVTDTQISHDQKITTNP